MVANEKKKSILLDAGHNRTKVPAAGTGNRGRSRLKKINILGCILAKIRPFTPGFSNWGPPDSDEISIILPYLGILARHISGIFPYFWPHTLENHISGNGLDPEKEKVLGNLTARIFPSANTPLCHS